MRVDLDNIVVSSDNSEFSVFVYTSDITRIIPIPTQNRVLSLPDNISVEHARRFYLYDAVFTVGQWVALPVNDFDFYAIDRLSDRGATAVCSSLCGDSRPRFGQSVYIIKRNIGKTYAGFLITVSLNIDPLT